MKKPVFFILLAIFFSSTAFPQKELAYHSHISEYREKYVSEHEVVKKNDKKFFRFFKPDYALRVEASFERIIDTAGFMMLTSSGKKSKYFIYGKMKFTLADKPFGLFVYQSQKLMLTEKLADYLFIPFTDITTGKESYGAGRYIDLLIKDLDSNKFILDFNKAYNPYCAYDTGFNCPIPPRQNYLDYAVRAGERTFGKRIH